jgi:GMP synthase (glutamine-hydrolysing)
MDTVLIIDFGGQYCHLIGRRVRDLGVYSEILPFDAPISAVQALGPIGVILSGGPSSVYEASAPRPVAGLFEYLLEAKIPVLGLCYGHQLIAQSLGGQVEGHQLKEFGKTLLRVTRAQDIFEGLGEQEQIWMSHGDQVQALPPGYEIYGTTETCPIAAYGNPALKVYGLQFHPEVVHTLNGNNILKNFLYGVCGAAGDWSVQNWIPEAVEKVQAQVGENGQVVLGLSGGVDSSVVAALLQRAIGDRVHLIFINNGLLRLNEETEVQHTFRDVLRFANFHYVDASDLFLDRLAGVTDPEEKRRIIGHTFIEVFETKATELETQFPTIEFLAQGTIYPDRVETAATGNATAKIKSHHNLTLPSDMRLQLCEPLRDLYKDEVRRIGLELGVPENIINRHPFPGPGLAVRCVGAITRERLDVLKRADAIVVEEIRAAGLYNSIWQAFAVHLPVQTVGVMGDARTYENICAVRVVESIDAMTANFAKLDWDLLERISTRIINEVRGVNRVVYDISNKPPSTIEFE